MKRDLPPECDSLAANSPEFEDPRDAPWAGIGWIALGILAVWSALAAASAVVYWLGVFAVAILQALWSLL